MGDIIPSKHESKRRVKQGRYESKLKTVRYRAGHSFALKYILLLCYMGHIQEGHMETLVSGNGQPGEEREQFIC